MKIAWGRTVCVAALALGGFAADAQQQALQDEPAQTQQLFQLANVARAAAGVGQLAWAPLSLMPR